MTMIPNTKIMITNTNNAVQLDSKIGTLHLELLGYESGDRVYFRCLEGKGYKLPPKNKSYVMGQINWDELARLQAQGYDIFLGVNGGNCDNDVVECRALFLEWDDIDKEEQWRRLGELAAAGFPDYSFVVETARSLHAYWVLEECLPPDVWKVLQRELIKATDSDPTIKNPSRFMRLGGSLYIQRGTEPFPCQLHLGTGQKINLARLKHGFRQITPPPENPQTEVQKTPTKNAINLIPFLAKKHQLLIETGAKTGSRNARGYALACDLIGVENWLKERGFSPQQTAQDLFMLYCQRCSTGEGWCSTEWEKIWQSALKSEPKPCCNNNVLNARLKRIAGVDKSEEKKRAKEKLADLRAGLPRLSPDKVLVVLERELGDRLRFNELTQTPELNGEPVDADLAYLALSQQVGAVINKEVCADALLFLAQRRRYNPVVEYLERVSQEVAPICIDNLASRYFGTTNPLYDVFVKKFLISAVARAYQPGCKVDTALILQGRQGQGKSSFFAVLGGAWFDDSMGPLNGKDDIMTLHRCWIQEWAEFDHLCNQRQASQIKSFLSRTVDRFRPPYGRCVKAFPRRSVLCGSTNQEEFLNDPTGSRRFWVIPTGSRPIDIRTLQQERDAIWAAAVHAYKAGEQWWLTPAEHDLSETLNLEYQQSDPWMDIIQTKLALPGAPSQVTTEYILNEWIGLPKDRHGKAEQRRIGAIMRRIGWEHSTQRIHGVPKKCWVKAAPEANSSRSVADVSDSGNNFKAISKMAPVEPPGGCQRNGTTNQTDGESPQQEEHTPQPDPNGLPAIKAGDFVRYEGDVPWILKMFGRNPVKVLSYVNGCLYLPNPNGGMDVPVLDTGWVKTFEPPMPPKEQTNHKEEKTETVDPLNIPSPIDFEKHVGKGVEYMGKTWILLDYFPVSGYCEIRRHEETICVPQNQIKL